MPLINDALQLYIGTTPAVAAYMNDVKVWPKTSQGALSASLSARTNPPAGAPWYTITTTYTGPVPVTYKFYSNTKNQGWVLRYTGGQGPHHFDTTYSSTFVMRVESFSGAGVLLGTATTNTVNTPAPPPTYQQRVVTLSAVEKASYRGNNTRRTDTSNLYFGQYDGTHGNQKSQARFSIPGDLRHCYRMDKVEVSIWGLHTFPNGGTTTDLVVHHNPSLSGNWGGNTGSIRKAPIGKPGWYGGAEWVDVTANSSAGRYTVAEEFRTYGAHGIGLRSPDGSTAQTYYGYARNDWRMRFTYTVRI